MIIQASHHRNAWKFAQTDVFVYLRGGLTERGGACVENEHHVGPA